MKRLKIGYLSVFFDFCRFISAFFAFMVFLNLFCHFTTLFDVFLADFEKEFGWMYETKHIDDEPQLFDCNTKGKINYTVWSDVLICPQCSQELVYWDIAVDKVKGEMKEEFKCPNCGVTLKKKNCKHAWDVYFDELQNAVVKKIKQIPVQINYFYNGKECMVFHSFPNVLKT